MIYSKSIEQALVIFPALIAALVTVAGGVPADEGGKLDFKIDLQDPPPCTTGFIPPSLIRSPGRHHAAGHAHPTCTARPRRTIRRVVRGARNYPCQEFPGKRAPTIQLCRDPKGYVPIGNNPWRGPPVPYGSDADHRSAEDPAAEQVPVHPAAGRPRSGTHRRCSCRRVCARARSCAARAVPAAGAAERPGAAAVAVPVLRAAGPGRAAVRQDAAAASAAGEPLPLPGQPLLTHLRLPDAPPLPAEAPPQASGQSFATYDQERRLRRPGRGNWRVRGWY